MQVSGNQASNVPQDVIQKAFVRIATLRIGASDVYPQLGKMIHGFYPVAVPNLRKRKGCGGFAMDQWGRFYFDPELILDPSSLTPPVNGVQTLIAIYLHEAWHWARCHPERIRTLPVGPDGKKVPHVKGNIAADAEIHGSDQFLRKHIPSWAVWPEKLKHKDTGAPLPKNETMEWYVANMKWDEDGGDDEGDDPGDEPRKGRRVGDVPDPDEPKDWELGPPDEDNPGLDRDEGDALRKFVAREIQKSVREKGNVPGNWESWAGEQVDPPKIPWQSQLNHFLREVREITAGATNYTFQRRSRRQHMMPRNVVIPASFHPKLEAAIGVDTSGSFSDDDLRDSVAEAMGILRVVGGSVFVACGDTRVTFEGRVSSADKIEFKGRGGTDMRVILRRCAKENPHVIVLFTDGGTSWPDERSFKVPVIVCLVGYHCGPENVPDWMHTVVVGD